MEKSVLALGIDKVESIRMNKTTYKAVEAAKAKYETLLKYAKKNGLLPASHKLFPDSDNCSLCKLYNNLDAHLTVPDTGCVGCPIREVTGDEGCYGTKYNEIEPRFMDEFRNIDRATLQRQAFKEFVTVFNKMLKVADVKRGAKTKVKFSSAKTKRS